MHLAFDLGHALMLLLIGLYMQVHANDWKEFVCRCKLTFYHDIEGLSGQNLQLNTADTDMK